MTHMPRPLQSAIDLYVSYPYLRANPPKNEGWIPLIQRNLAQGIFNRDVWVVRVNFGYNFLESLSNLPSPIANSVLRTVAALISFFKADTDYFTPRANFCQAWQNLGYQLFSTVDCVVGVVTPAGALKLEIWRQKGLGWIETKFPGKGAQGPSSAAFKPAST